MYSISIDTVWALVAILFFGWRAQHLGRSLRLRDVRERIILADLDRYSKASIKHLTRATHGLASEAQVRADLDRLVRQGLITDGVFATDPMVWYLTHKGRMRVHGRIAA